MPPARRLGVVAPIAITLIGLALLVEGPRPPRAEEVEPFELPPLAEHPLLNPVEPEIKSVLEVGQEMSTAPDLADAHAVREPPSLDQVREHLDAGDTHRARLAAEAFVDAERYGRDRNAALLVLGLLHREAGRHNLASEAFTKVRVNGGPLEAWGAYYEAEQDLARGRAWVAVSECEKVREKWPRGHHANACLRLIARAQASLGRSAQARAAAAEYDDDNEFGHIGESIELQLALQAREADPGMAVAYARKLAIEHDNPLTGRIAEEILAEAVAADPSVEGMPDDVESLKRRAVSLRDAKRRDEAWSLFQELMTRAEDDPELASWVEDSAERFGWRTHRWDFLAELYAAQYAEEKKGEHAWNHYRALDRGGRHVEAGTFALQAMKDHGGTREWRRQEEYVARTLMLAKDYAGATSLYDTVARRGGWTGRRARFFAAFSTFMAGDSEAAIERFTAIVDDDSSYVSESRYWRSRALDALERADEALADRRWILENDPHSWYAVLVDQLDGELPRMRPFLRDGSWAGAPLPTPPRAAPADSTLTVTATPPLARPVGAPARSGSTAFGTLAWPAGGYLAPLHEPVVSTVIERLDEIEPPHDYKPGALYDVDDARKRLDRLARNHGDDWPDLPAIHDLASAGLYDLSGPLMAEWFETWRDAYRNPRSRKYAAARELVVRGSEWRQMFYYARDHHHGSRFTYGMWDDLDDPQLDLESYRLAHPLAHDTSVWQESREHGMDPYLVLGLMRAESTYNAVAVSRVGARGAMQIMPRTGHLLADLAHDVGFTSGDLEDPTLSVAYGIRYLGLLMDRFEGAYPLAIASYNGGPFNVSTWLEGTTAAMPMDAFVEHIPFKETRAYVKKVSANYALYLDLYAPGGTKVVLPPTPRGDHPEVVDF